MKRKKLLGIPLFAGMFNQIVNAVTLSVPKGNYSDVNVTNTQVQGNPDKVLGTISFVNDYLWFTI